MSFTVSPGWTIAPKLRPVPTLMFLIFWLVAFALGSAPGTAQTPRSRARDLTEAGAADPIATNPVEQGILNLIPRTISGYVAAVRGNLQPLQQLQRELDDTLIPLATQSLNLAQGPALTGVSPQSAQTVITPVVQLQQQLQQVSDRLQPLRTLFLAEPAQAFNYVSQFPPGVNPDAIVSPEEAQQMADNLLTAITAYNQIVLDANPAQLQVLSENTTFVALGRYLKQLGNALIYLGEVPSLDTPVQAEAQAEAQPESKAEFQQEPGGQSKNVEVE